MINMAYVYPGGAGAAPKAAGRRQRERAAQILVGARAKDHLRLGPRRNRLSRLGRTADGMGPSRPSDDHGHDVDDHRGPNLWPLLGDGCGRDRGDPRGSPRVGAPVTCGDDLAGGARLAAARRRRARASCRGRLPPSRPEDDRGQPGADLGKRRPRRLLSAAGRCACSSHSRSAGCGLREIREDATDPSSQAPSTDPHFAECERTPASRDSSDHGMVSDPEGDVEPTDLDHGAVA